MITRRHLLIVSLVASTVTLAAAEPSKPEKTAAPKAAKANGESREPVTTTHASPRTTLRDPTEPDASLKPPVTPGLGSKKAGAGPVPPPTMPSIALKGLIIVKGKPGRAMIEVNRELHVVSEGDSITMTRESQQKLTFSVVSLTKDDVRIEAKELKETVILR